MKPLREIMKIYLPDYRVIRAIGVQLNIKSEPGE